MGNEYMRENNVVNLCGVITSKPEFSHSFYGDNFYIFDMNVKRLSGVEDSIPVLVSDRLFTIEELTVGANIRVNGQFRSFNNRSDDGKGHLILSVFAFEIYFTDDDTMNEVVLDGYICKEPIYRKTPLGREIADLLIAVNRSYGKSDYIPCICWGRNARFASGFGVKSHVRIHGRIQSREYDKRISDTEMEHRTAYELSIYRIELMEE